MSDMWRFHSPFWLLLILPLLLATGWSVRVRRQTAVLYSSVKLLKTLPKTLMLRLKGLLPLIQVFGLLLIVIALARPQYGLRDFRVRTEGIAVEMCLDRSGSMQALDFQLDGERVNRLEAVKEVFHNFVLGKGGLDGRPDDLIGLVSFGGFAEGKAPLTLDHGALLQVLDSIDVPQPIKDAHGQVINERFLQEEMATAIGDAVALAVDRLKNTQAKSKVIILLSDGENTAGVVDPLEAAEAAKTLGIKIYAIGVGTTGQAPFPGVDGFGRKVLMSQPVRLDEKTLKKLAETTDGKYFNAQDTKALVGVYTEIDRLEKTLTQGRMYTEYRELYQWFMLPGLAIVVAEMVLGCTRFRSLP